MQLQTPFHRPDNGRAPFFDGMHEERASLSFVCPKCGDEVTLNVLQFVGRADDWFGDLGDDDKSQIAALFGCGYKEWDGRRYVKSHDAGHPYFGLTACHSCASEYLLYISFYEKQPARYIATFQGAAKSGA